jgi:transposase
MCEKRADQPSIAWRLSRQGGRSRIPKEMGRHPDMLRHGRVYHRTKPWTMRYRRWLQSQNFSNPAHQIALQEMLQAERNVTERVARLTGHIEALVPEWNLAPAVNALQALRGVALISAVTFMAEIGDVRRFESPMTQTPSSWSTRRF